MWIPKCILTWWENYKAEQKRRELYARLDRNAAGKFSMKDHRKQINESQKKQRAAKREMQDDARR